MDHRIARWPLLSYVFRHGRAIPIAPAREDAELQKTAFDQVAQALAEGELVAIFPEGGLSRDGQLAPFQPGVLKILERSPVPLIPMGLGGLWGSLFSRHPEGGVRAAWKQGLPRPIRLAIGSPIAPEKPDLARISHAVAALCKTP